MTRMIKTLAAAAVATAMLAAVPAQAADRSFYLTNNADLAIEKVYIKHLDTNQWGRDVLGTDILFKGDFIVLEPDAAFGYCRFDIKLVFERGPNQLIEDVNLCEVTDVTTQGRIDGDFYHDIAY